MDYNNRRADLIYLPVLKHNPMKKYFLLLPLAFIFLLSSSFNMVTPADVTIQVKKGGFKINTDDIISTAWSLEKMQAALGKADRDRDGYNITHTYDDLCMVLFEPKSNETGTGVVSEVQVYFRVKEPNNVTPTGNTFKGNLMVDKLKVTRELDSKTMLKKLKKWKKTDSYMEHNYRMASNGLYIYFQFADDEKTLLKVSIGPDKR